MAILGIDEVGRGPWAGPLVVGAVVLGDCKIESLTDSKKLSRKRREALAKEICEKAEYGLGWVFADELDEIGLSSALQKACREAVKQIHQPYHEIIIDGTVNFLRDTHLSPYVQVLKKADLLVPEVSASSIVAKVARDNYMKTQAKKYPWYGFEKHVGYGTAEHRRAIEKYGICPEHRKSFRPIAEAMKRLGQQKDTTKARGDEAEARVAEYLEKQGHAIVARNWRTRYCEIDIISQKNRRFYFTEVKYRCNARRGDGLDAITLRKLQKMRLGAELFAEKHELADVPLCLAVANVGGEDFQIKDYLILE